MAAGKRFLTALVGLGAIPATLSLEAAAAPINKHDAAVAAEWERLVEREARIKSAVSKAMEQAQKRAAAAIATTKLGKRRAAAIESCAAELQERHSDYPDLILMYLKDCENFKPTVYTAAAAGAAWLVYDRPKWAKMHYGVCWTFFDEELKAVRKKYGKSVEAKMIEEIKPRCAR